MSLFNHTYEIKGKHAQLVKELTKQDKLNCRNIDIFFMSLALGIKHKKETFADIKSKEEPAKIDSEQMVKYNDDIEFFYKLIMLTDKNYCPSSEERCNKAFRYINTEKAEKDEEHFTKVMLGGLEYLYEQIAENTLSLKDIYNNIKDFDERYDEE